MVQPCLESAVFRQIGLILPAVAVLLWGMPARPAGTARISTAAHTARFDLLTGEYWERIADPRHPEAPPRWAAVAATKSESHSCQPLPVAILRAGHPLQLKAGGANSLFRMEAVALESGTPGNTVRARITLTGAVVEVMIVDQDTALLAGRSRGQQ